MDTVYIFLQHYWWFIISLLGALLVFLLFVQGGQGMLYLIGRTDTERNLIVNTLGRKWELTFTTLVTFGGAFFASFPLFYSTSFGGAFYVWMLILLVFVIQAVAYEFRRKPSNFLGEKTYNWFLLINGVLGAFLLGTAVATLFTGAPFTVGLVTGLLHTFMGIPAILAGILTQLALYSINLKIMGKANQSINVDKYGLLISLRWVKEFALHNPIIMVILATAVVIGVLYWFFGTELGCGIRATGSNPAMSRAQGINTNFNIVLGLAVSNALVALSGALLSQYQGFADVGMGRGAIVIGLAAVIIGEAVFGRIFHNFALKMASVSIGAIIYYIVIQLVLTLGFDANLLKLLSASVVAVFLAVPYWKGKYFSKPVKKAKEDAKNA